MPKSGAEMITPYDWILRTTTITPWIEWEELPRYHEMIFGRPRNISASALRTAVRKLLSVRLLEEVAVPIPTDNLEDRDTLMSQFGHRRYLVPTLTGLVLGNHILELQGLGTFRPEEATNKWRELHAGAIPLLCAIGARAMLKRWSKEKSFVILSGPWDGAGHPGVGWLLDGKDSPIRTIPIYGKRQEFLLPPGKEKLVLLYPTSARTDNQEIEVWSTED